MLPHRPQGLVMSLDPKLVEEHKRKARLGARRRSRAYWAEKRRQEILDGKQASSSKKDV